MAGAVTLRAPPWTRQEGAALLDHPPGAGHLDPVFYADIPTGGSTSSGMGHT